MKLDRTAAVARLTAHDHGTLATVHPRRGVHMVPCLYAVIGDRLAIPIDRVKPKAAGSLQRERNVAADPRAAVLIEHWDRDDWTALWWVRAELRRCPDAPPGSDPDPAAPDRGPAAPTEAELDAFAARFEERFAQYRDRPFERLMVFDVVDVHGWSAAA